MGRDCSRSLHIQAWHLWSTKVPRSWRILGFSPLRLELIGGYPFIAWWLLWGCHFSVFLKFISNIFRSQYVDTSWYIMINPCKSATSSLNPATFEYLYRCGRFFHIPWPGSGSQHIWHGQSLMLTLKHFSSSWLVQNIPIWGEKVEQIICSIKFLQIFVLSKPSKFLITSSALSWFSLQNMAVLCQNVLGEWFRIPTKNWLIPWLSHFIPSSSPTWRAGKSTI